MAANDLPYSIEYAKSNRSKCKHCNKNIDKDVVRIAIMIQSNFHDGKDPLWHHEDCFFAKTTPDKISEFAGFLLLNNNDQQRLLQRIRHSVANENKVSKRSADTERDRFHVEYSKNDKASCRLCWEYIEKFEIRIHKAMYDTHITKKIGIEKELFWYHLDCFAKTRLEILYMDGPERLPGFEKLKKRDQKLIIQKFEEIKPDQPWKKSKMDGDSAIMKKFKKQNVLCREYHKALNGASDMSLENVLEANSQTIPKTRQEKLNLIADMMAFGALEPCPKCNTGRQLVLETFGYKCTGHATEYTECNYITQDPKRHPMIVPEECKNLPCFKNYTPKIGVRLFLSDEELLNVRKSKPPVLPLTNFKFLLRGNTAQDNNYKKRILKLGGLVLCSPHHYLAAVVCPESDFETAVLDSEDEYDSDYDEEEAFTFYRENNIDFVNPSFLKKIEDRKKGSPKISAQIIADNNYASWGGDKHRILESIEDSESSSGSDSEDATSSDDSISATTVSAATSQSLSQGSKGGINSEAVDNWKKVMGGGKVEPESGLQDEAHILTDDTNVKYTASLCKSDITANKNSFYKIQALESNDKTKYWIFRSWGRIGAPRCSCTRNDVADANAATEMFKKLFFEKTGNTWENRDNFKKAPGLYEYVNYGSEMISEFDLDYKSKVPMQVQKLVRYILDPDNMMNIMRHFKIDTDKMPLGKLSKEQIESGYAVLRRLNDHVEAKDNDKIVDDTNRFYTLIPHNFGLDKAPLLDNMKLIEEKILLLDNLLEIENAYSLINSGNVVGIENQYKKFKSDITPLDSNSEEYKMIVEYVRNTHAPSHTRYTLDVAEVFQVKRHGEEERYNKFKSLSNRRLLWHGSRTVNFAGILPEGLHMAPPKVIRTGDMFGNGIYFADMVTKSANYCNVDADKPTGLMLLCEVALGNMDKCFSSKKSQLEAGLQCRWGVGEYIPDPSMSRTLPCGTLVPLGKPVLNPDMKPNRKHLIYNEFIVYNVAQVNIKYLVKMNFNFKTTK